jgi:hypothetical protein
VILHFGVTDLPYAAPRGKTTGDVADILEAKYHVVEVFYEENKEAVAGLLEESLQGAIESLVMGAPVTFAPLSGGLSRIEERFKKFLSDKEMDRLGYPGVPTAASLRGVSHRFKRPYAKRAPRPSFIDTGLYQSSFRTWTTN